MISSTITEFELPVKQRIEVTEKPSEVENLPPEDAKQPLIWINIFGIATLHILAFYSLITSAKDAKFWTWIFSKFTLY